MTGVTAALAPLKVRRDAEIYATEGGWFRGRWHFSFDQYHDPENMGIERYDEFGRRNLLP